MFAREIPATYVHSSPEHLSEWVIRGVCSWWRVGTNHNQWPSYYNDDGEGAPEGNPLFLRFKSLDNYVYYDRPVPSMPDLALFPKHSVFRFQQAPGKKYTY